MSVLTPSTLAGIEEALAKHAWADDWPHNIVPAGAPAQKLACDLIRLAPALLSAARRGLDADGWRDIASAPKDGTWILVWLGGVANCADTIQWAYDGWWNGCSGYVRSEGPPTHWRPLPDPPALIPTEREESGR